MRQHKTRIFCLGGALCLTLALAATAPAASSFTSSLVFTGDSTMAATQTAVAGTGAAGFTFSHINGLDGSSVVGCAACAADPTVVFGASGATFGSLIPGDGGRNYMRTNDSDYATTSFYAEITVVRTNNDQAAMFGMGTGKTYLYGVPDWATFVSSTHMGTGNGEIGYFRTANDVNSFLGSPNAAIMATGTQRYRMTFDASAKTITYAVDLDYMGGGFMADHTTPPIDLNHVSCPFGCGGGEEADFFAVDGWPNEPSSVFFGGDDGAILRDFSVTVTPAGVPGDYNGNLKVDAADYVLWRNGGSPDSSPAGYALWKANFGNPPGAGSGSALATVPEPASLVLFVIGWAAFQVTRQRRGCPGCRRSDIGQPH